MFQARKRVANWLDIHVVGENRWKKEKKKKSVEWRTILRKRKNYKYGASMFLFIRPRRKFIVCIHLSHNQSLWGVSCPASPTKESLIAPIYCSALINTLRVVSHWHQHPVVQRWGATKNVWSVPLTYWQARKCNQPDTMDTADTPCSVKEILSRKRSVRGMERDNLASDKNTSCDPCKHHLKNLAWGFSTKNWFRFKKKR